MNKLHHWTRLWTLGMLSVALPLAIQAQEDDDKEVFELSPFSVEASEDDGYMATTTLAGSRVRSNLRDLGASIAVVTQEFMQDTGGTDGQSILQFIGNMEVGGVLGNFSDVNPDNSSTLDSRINPQSGQRVRGLVSATLTRDYFQTNIPFDGYNTSRVTVNRGPNSILFGLGSPGGVIDNTTNKAQINAEFGELSVRFDHNGGHRQTVDVNKTLIEDRLAIRVSILNDKAKYRQEPAFDEDRRFFVAWDLTLFKNQNSNWLGRSSFRGSFENGEIYSNPPDVVPPTDGFSSWWNGIGDQTRLNQLLSVPGVDLSVIGDGAVTKQQVLSAISSGLVTVPEGLTADAYATSEGQFVPKTPINRFQRGRGDPTDGGRLSQSSGAPYFLFPAINFNTINTQVPGWNDPNLAGIQGIMGRWRPRSGTKDVSWSTPATAGAGFRERSLDNRDVFDYHKILFQGTSNYVDTDFDATQFYLEQELFGGYAGFELAYDKQTRQRTDFTPFSTGANKRLAIDLDLYLAPGDLNDDGIPDSPWGAPNENFSRPVVDWDANDTTFSTTEQETYRATLFGTLDTRDFIDGTLGKILGKHTLTGLFEDRTNDFWNKSTRGSWWADTGKWPGSPDISNGLSDNFRRIVKSQIYLGPQTSGLSSPDQVRIDGGLDVPFPKIGDTYGIWYFDNAGSVKTGVKNTWRIIENIQGANIGRSELESKAFSLQSHLLWDHIVGMYAIRNDKQTVYQRLQETQDYGDPSVAGVRPLRLDLPGINEVDGTFNEGLLVLEDTPASEAEDDTTTWSIVGKYPEDLIGELPWGIDLTGHYYEAESFQPAGISNNVLNQPLASPFGKTKEYGFTLSLLDNRLSIRTNWFETVNANARTGGMNGQLSQIVGRFNFFLTRVGEAESAIPLSANAADLLLTPETTPNNRTRKTGTDADLIPGVTSYDEYYAKIIALIPPQVQSVYNFKVNKSGSTVNIESTPIRGLDSTQDFVAKGMEIDITGRITDNWSLALNVGKQETVTSNTGPVAIPLALEIEEKIQALFPSKTWGWAAIRDSPFQGEAGTLGTRYAVVTREMRIQRGKDNTVSQEQRKWRVNLTTRYDFLEGMLKGFQAGGSLRYQSKVAGGYPNIFDETGTVIPHIASPWYGPDDLTGDLFVRYNRKLTDKIDWSIQLNARNLYRKNGAEDIPVTFDPDGTIQIARIPVEQQFFLTNTFSF